MRHRIRSNTTLELETDFCERQFSIEDINLHLTLTEIMLLVALYVSYRLDHFQEFQLFG